MAGPNANTGPGANPSASAGNAPVSEDERRFFEALHNGLDPDAETSSPQVSLLDDAKKENDDDSITPSMKSGVFTVPVPDENPEEDENVPELIASVDTGSEKNDSSSENGNSLFQGATSPDGFDQVGTASWYGRDFNGLPTASGEIFNARQLTAAHKELPLGSIVMVRNLDNGKEVLLKVNDRGPFVDGRVLDVSEYGAEVLGFRTKGLATVGIKLVKKGDVASRGPGLTSKYFGDSSDQSAYSVGGEDDDITESDYVSAAIRGKDSVTGLPGGDLVLPAQVMNEADAKGFSVQVGIFDELKNAVSLRNYLNAYGVPVNIYRRDSSYVVKAGEFSTRYAAEQLKYQMVADGYSVFISEPE